MFVWIIKKSLNTRWTIHSVVFSDSDVFRSEGLVHQRRVHGRFAGIHVNPSWSLQIAEDFRPHVVRPIDNMTGLIASNPCFPRLQGKWHCKTRLFPKTFFDLTLFDTEYLHSQLRILQHFMLQSQAENHQAAEWAAKQGKAIGPFSTATSASL